MKIRDVAKAAGVSIATVSRVINHPEMVTPETREHVQAVINGSNYSPAGASKQKRRDSRSKAIAFIVSGPQKLGNILLGIRSVCEKKTYVTSIYMADQEKSQMAFLENITEKQADGLIIDYDWLTSAGLEWLKTSGVPFVCVGGTGADPDVNCCYINYFDTAGQMAEKLADKAEDEALLLLNEPLDACGEQMIAGFKAKWRGRVQIEFTHNIPEESYLLMRDILDERECPAAILTQTDEMAVGVLKAVGNSGLTVAEQVRVAGFDNASYSAFLTPELTTVEQPTYRLGLLAARILFDLMEDEEMFEVEPQQIMLKGRLKIRQTCGNRKAIYQEYE